MRDESERAADDLAASKFKRIVDLSTSLYVGMPSWQTNPELLYGPVKLVARDNFTLNVVSQMHMHVGTHVDAPLHSIIEGKTIDNYDIEKFVGPGVVLDFRMKKPGEEIGVQEMREFDSFIKRDDVVMLCTDWSKRTGMNPDYLYKWPYLGESGAKFLAQKQVRAVGTEGMSIAGWTDKVPAQGPVTDYSSTIVHNLLLEKDVLVIEGLSNLSELLGPEKTARASFIFAPIKFLGVEAAPCRALALV